MSYDIGQAPLVMVHKKVFTPTPRPVIPEFGSPGVVTEPVPERTDHVPIPTIGVFPFNIEADEQIAVSFPASDGVANVLIVTTMVSVDGAHVPLEIVHTKVFTPTLTPVIVVVGKVGFVIVPTPETIVHKHVPTIGVFPFNVADEEQIRKSGPALAIVG